MYTDVYVDVLLLINLSMDAVSLLITSRLCAQMARPWRIFAAASIGAVYSLISLFIPLTVYFEVLIFLAVSVLMSCISFKPESLEETVKVSLVLFISSAMLGGVMSAMYEMLSGLLGEMFGEHSDQAVISPAMLFILGAVSFFAAMFLCRLHGSGNCPDMGVIEIKMLGKTAICKGFFDSGNLLSDPLSGRPVVVVRESCIRSILPSYSITGHFHMGLEHLGRMSDRERARFRLIPAKGIGGGAHLCGFVPDELTLEYTYKGKSRRKDTNAIVAVVSDNDVDVECIIPASIV